MTCYKGKNCSSNPTTIPQIRWYLYSRLQCEFNKLPPTQAALKYKIFRCHYVILVLRRAYLAITNLPSPLSYGWEAKDDVYVPIMTDELPVPLELMELKMCGCKTSCNTMRYKCVKNQMLCKALCKCVSCKNDSKEFDVIVHNCSSEDQHWLSSSLIIPWINNCCVICRYLVCERILFFTYNFLYFESMKYFLKSNNFQ